MKKITVNLETFVQIRSDPKSHPLHFLGCGYTGFFHKGSKVELVMVVEITMSSTVRSP